MAFKNVMKYDAMYSKLSRMTYTYMVNLICSAWRRTEEGSWKPFMSATGQPPATDSVRSKHLRR